MSKIYHPEISAKIIAIMEDVALSNNGYSYMSAIRPDVKRAVELAGYVVKANPNGVYGPNGVIVFSAAAWLIFQAEANERVAAIRASVDNHPAFDYEAAILARNVDHLFA
jgi:hypothetical protein